MRLPKILKYILFFIVIAIYPSSVFAQYVSGEFDVVVNVNVPDDTFSTVDVNPSTVEIMEPATVTVTIQDGSLNPLSNHYIQLVAPGLTFVQPSNPTNSQGKVTVSVYSDTPGTYSIVAYDITDPLAITEIADSATLYVTPVPIPVLIEEPIFTIGNSNEIYWNSLGSGYQYLLESSSVNDFSTIYKYSNWVTGSMYEFNTLSNGVMYFYRAKARNIYGGESGWSNVVFSVQDSEGPVITLLSVSDIGENNTVEWQSSYQISIVYKVEDNLSLESVNFYCVRSNGSRYECGNTTHNGSIYTTTIRLSELDKDGIAYLYENYSFCIVAEDSVGNSSQLCDIELSIPPWSEPEEPVVPGEDPEPSPEPEPEPEPKPPAPVPTFIGRVINDVIDSTEYILENMFGDLDQYELENINTTTTIATFTVGLGALLGGILYIPIYLFELLLGLLSWLGLRKKGEYAGFVYDSGSKEPISQAIVRVYDTEKRLVWTDVTGSRGSFDLALDDGTFSINVTSSNHSFPSKVIFGKADYPLENVYHGENFVVNEGVIPQFSIPMDHRELGWFKSIWIAIRSRLSVLFKVLSIVLFLFGLVFSIYTYYINPNIFNLIIIVLYIPSFLLVVKALFKRGLDYGIVKDIEGNTVSDISVGLRDVEYKKIVGKRVTDGKGRYRFVVDPGSYTVEVLDTGYEIVSIEEKKLKELSDNSVLIDLDIVIKVIDVEK